MNSLSAERSIYEGVVDNWREPERCETVAQKMEQGLRCVEGQSDTNGTKKLF